MTAAAVFFCKHLPKSQPRPGGDTRRRGARLWKRLLLPFVLAVPAQALAQAAIPPAAKLSYEAGLDARARGDMQAAALAFEQALLLAPNFAGAWFDYGTTLCDLGDPSGCRNILATAIAQFGLPPALRQGATSIMRVQQGELRVGLGASTNLLRATSANDLTLLLDGVEVRAFLADGYRERGGGLAEAAFNYQSSWPLHNITARLDLLGRRPFDSALPGLTAGYAEVGIGLNSLGLEELGFNPRSRAGLMALWVNEGYLGGLRSAGLWAEHQLSPEGAVLRATLEHRKPRDQSGWLTTRLVSRTPLTANLRMNLAFEYDTPQNERAGYSQTRYAFDLRHERTLPTVGGYVPRLALEAGVLHARDRRAYSPLFGDVRNIRTRWQLAADLAINLNRQWRINLGLLAARQNATIALFDYRELSAMLSVTYRFD